MEFLNSKEKELKEKVTKIENEITIIESQSLIDTDYINTVLKNFLHMFEEADIELKKRLLHSLIDNISVKDGNGAKNNSKNNISF